MGDLLHGFETPFLFVKKDGERERRWCEWEKEGKQPHLPWDKWESTSTKRQREREWKRHMALASKMMTLECTYDCVLGGIVES